MEQAIIPYLGGLRADCWKSEDHTRELEVTENPVESGLNVNDHAFRKPQELTIEFGVSNFPLPTDMAFSTDSFFGEFGTDRVGRARDLLFLMQDDKVFLEVITLGGGTYKNMLLKTISWQTDSRMSQAAIFTLTLKELIITSTKTVKYKPKAAKTKQQTSKRTDKGEVPAKQPDKLQQKAIDNLGIVERFAPNLIPKLFGGN